MIGTYILFSEQLSKFYIGATQEDINLRIQKHNQKSYGIHKFTAAADDWELYLFISVLDFAQAIRVERKIKSMKSTKYIMSLQKYPELILRLVNSTKLSR